MFRANIIRPSNSPWASPIVVVDKKDGSKRFCVDYRKLNKRTTLSSWPLPVTDDLLASLGKAKYFTCLNLKSGYWQVAVNEKDKEETAFTSHRGLYEYNVRPFGFQNVPSTFQRLMSTVLRDMSHLSLAYLDDMIIFSPSMHYHALPYLDRGMFLVVVSVPLLVRDNKFEIYNVINSQLPFYDSNLTVSL